MDKIICKYAHITSTSQSPFPHFLITLALPISCKVQTKHYIKWEKQNENLLKWLGGKISSSPKDSHFRARTFQKIVAVSSFQFKMNTISLNLEDPIRDAISRIRFGPHSNNLLISSWDSVSVKPPSSLYSVFVCMIQAHLDIVVKFASILN